LQKPIIPVNHLYGHIFANWINRNADEILFPALALVVSGGHTDLVVLQDFKTLEVIGGTRDDAAGEAFDKIGRLLGLPYPAGATISKLAQTGDKKAFSLPRPLLGSGDFDFSFSGLKTAALREVQRLGPLKGQALSDFCAAVEWSIVDVLVKKTVKAMIHYNVKSLLLGGGVAANKKLTERLHYEISNMSIEVSFFVPPAHLCTDNGAMIAAAGFFANALSWKKVAANPELYY
jgi:N6-L-threonylcarbamoyladenine synthase